MKKLAVVISGWHYPYQFYRRMKEQHVPKDWEIDMFIVSHRDPEEEVVSNEKNELFERGGDNILQNCDKDLYQRYITKAEIEDLGYIYNEEPNDVGDLFLFSQWVDRHWKSQYDIVMYIHDDTYILSDSLFVDILEQKAQLIVSPTAGRTESVPSNFEWHHMASGTHGGTTCPRTSFTVVTKELLDKLAPDLHIITTTNTDGSDISFTRTNETDTPYVLKGDRIDTDSIDEWNAPGRNFWRWCEVHGYHSKSVRLSDTYRVTPYFIEGERGFMWTPHNAQRPINYLQSRGYL